MEATISTLVFFPELLRRETLAEILKCKFQKINANPVKIDRFNDDELIEFARRFLVPKPQRQNGTVGYSVKKRRREIDEQENGTMNSYVQQCNDSIPDISSKTVDNCSNCKAFKRKSGTVSDPVCKKRLKHSPIRFP